MLATLLFVSSCAMQPYHAREPRIYELAIERSMYPTAAKQGPVQPLRPGREGQVWSRINGDDHILMMTWKAKNYYPDSGRSNTGPYEIWVTAAPELYGRMKSVKPAERSLRLKQLLGLPPNAQNRIFIEIWVKPGDLFRPCPDREIGDSLCNLNFSAADSADQDYIRWFNTSRIDRYYATGLYNRYPWTQLGYTYDWHPRNSHHIGLSEFVIRKNSEVMIRKAYTTDEYLDGAGLYR